MIQSLAIKSIASRVAADTKSALIQPMKKLSEASGMGWDFEDDDFIGVKQVGNTI